VVETAVAVGTVAAEVVLVAQFALVDARLEMLLFDRPRWLDGLVDTLAGAILSVSTGR
jgi:hypothetical protein